MRADVQSSTHKSTIHREKQKLCSVWRPQDMGNWWNVGLNEAWDDGGFSL